MEKQRRKDCSMIMPDWRVLSSPLSGKHQYTLVINFFLMFQYKRNLSSSQKGMGIPLHITSSSSKNTCLLTWSKIALVIATHRAEHNRVAIVLFTAKNSAERIHLKSPKTLSPNQVIFSLFSFSSLISHFNPISWNNQLIFCMPLVWGSLLTFCF